MLVWAEELGRRIGSGRKYHKAIVGMPKLALTVDVLYATGAA